MERRFDVRLEELLDDAVLDGRIPEGMLERLKEFVAPFAACLLGSKQQRHIWEYVSGLFSDVKRKNAETIGVELGEPDGVLVFDPSAFKKQGKKSVGVARQWCRRFGRFSHRCCTSASAAVRLLTFAATTLAAYSETSLPMRTIGNHVNDCLL